MTQRRIPGILGGMGPEATIDLFAKIVRSTRASRDQDHLRIIIDNNPAIPDRQKAILENGVSPVKWLVETARNLERAGADFIVMPCNTAHYWIEDIRKVVGIPVVDMIEETAEELARAYPSLRTVGILAATGTVRSGLYQKNLSRLRINCVSPADDDQLTLMGVIYSVKAGDFSKHRVAAEVAGRVVIAGAEAVVSGCTEIPLVLKTEDLSVPLIDATQVLASRTVEISQGLRSL
jgi:aspartate racemase